MLNIAFETFFSPIPTPNQKGLKNFNNLSYKLQAI